MNCLDSLNRKLGRLIREPDNHELYNDIGVLLFELKDYGNAQKYLACAWEIAPSNPDILYNYAQALYACFEWSKSVEIFKQYVVFQPNDNTAIEKIADACYQLGDFCSAARYQKVLLSKEDGL
jgi:type IV pilus assembly protein PilF